MEILKLRSKSSIGEIRRIRIKYNLEVVSDHHEPEHSIADPKPVLLNPTLRSPRRTIKSFLSCDLCHHKTTTKSSLERHINQIHVKSPKASFECKECSKVFTRKSTLLTHEKIHKDSRDSFKCEICCKVLSSKAALVSHNKWFHTTAKEFKCQQCAKLFATVSGVNFSCVLIVEIILVHLFQKGSLREHEKTHSDVKSLACPICRKSFKTASLLAHHIDTHDTTEYHCKICDKQLNTKRTLATHMITHSDVQKFTCRICEAKFKRTKGYKEHLMAVHTNLKPYKCDWCQKTFSNGPNCRKHKRDSHPNELKKIGKSEDLKPVALPSIKELEAMVYVSDE